MGSFTKWFLYGTNTATDKLARDRIERGEPATKLEAAALAADIRKENNKAKRKANRRRK